MTILKKFSTFMALMLVLATTSVYASDDSQKLFVNLTSDNINRAAMAISFSTRVRMEKKIPVTIFLNIDGVRIADKNIPGHRHAKGKTLKEMLAGFLQAGGRVIVCPMCMKNVGGMDKDDLVDGVEVGSSEVTWPALFADDTTVLSY